MSDAAYEKMHLELATEPATEPAVKQDSKLDADRFYTGAISGLQIFTDGASAADFQCICARSSTGSKVFALL